MTKPSATPDVTSSNSERLMQAMKDFAERMATNVKEHPQAYSTAAGAGLGALIGGGVAENSVEGALKGAGAGAASGFALANILKNPPPAIPAKGYEDRPEAGVIGKLIENPGKAALLGGGSLTAGAVTALPYARYKVGKKSANTKNPVILADRAAKKAQALHEWDQANVKANAAPAGYEADALRAEANRLKAIIDHPDLPQQAQSLTKILKGYFKGDPAVFKQIFNAPILKHLPAALK